MAAVFGIGFLGANLFIAITFGLDLLREPQVWAEGLEVPITSSKGSCHNYILFLPLSNCSLKLTYEEPGGAVHSKVVQVLLFADIEPKEKARLKIDPENPDSIALSWLINRLEERWIALGGFCLAGFAISVLICAGLVRTLWEWRLYRKMGRSPHPIPVTILGKRLVTIPDHAWEYSFRYEVTGVERHGRQRLRVLKRTHDAPPESWAYETPIMLGKDSALALLDSKGRALLVPQSFRPFVLSEEEAKEVLRFASHHA